MKKNTLLSIAFTMMLCINSYAQITEDFETDPPSGWTFMQTEGDDPGFIQTSDEANGGTFSFFHDDDNIAAESTSWMISPSYTVLAGDFLSFFYFHDFSGYGVENGVYISTASANPITNPGDFTLLYDLLGNASEDAWASNSTDLTTYVGQTVYIAFKYVGDYADELFIDDFAIAAPPAEPDCAATPFPADSATDITVGDVTFTWVAPASGPTPTSYNLYAGTESDYSDQALVGNYTTTTADLVVSGYTTTIYWQVIPVNGTAEATGCGYWSFTTEDAPPAPANDTLAGATPIVPSAEGTGCSTYAFANSTAGDGTTDSGLDGTCNNTDTGLDRFYSWTATSDALIWNDGDGNPGIVIRTDTGVEITCATTFAAEDTELSGWTIGDDLIIQIYDYGTADVATSFCLEEFTLPTCIEPTNLTLDSSTDTTAQISWALGDSESSWEYVVQESGSGEPAGAGTSTSDNPLSISSLTELTDYEIYVRADCGAGDFSVWAGPFTFRTQLAPIAPNYMIDFTAFPGDGWSEATGVYGTPSGTTSSWIADDFGNDVAHANGASARINVYGTLTDEYLVSPTFDLSGGTHYLNFDIALTEYANTNTATFGADDYVALLVTQDDGFNWTELARWDSSTSILAIGQSITEIELVGYNATTQLALYAFSDTTNEDNDFFVDNFQLTTSSLSVEDNIIKGFSIYPNPVNDVLQLRALDNIDVVSIYNLLGQEVKRMQPKLLQTQVDMADLPTGMYVVKVQVGEQLGSYRIVKQ